MRMVRIREERGKGVLVIYQGGEGLEGWRVGRAGKGVEGIHPRGGLEGNIVTFKLNMRYLGLFGPLALVSYGTCSSKRWE